MSWDNLSLEPDADMKWIYDQTRPDYYDAYTVHLRESRDRALRSAPEWMIRIAEFNDAWKKVKP